MLPLPASLTAARARGLALALIGATLGAATSGCARRTAVASPVAALIAERPYGSRVPAHLDPARAYPLVILLHGLGGQGRNVQRFFGLGAMVDSPGLLLAYPDGITERFQGETQRFWNATDLCCAFTDVRADDVAYLDAIIDDMSAKYRVDPKRIFVAGLSNGGYMAHRYACDRASRVAGIVSVAGAMWTDASRCRPTEPVAVLQIHGDADAIVPYQGGTSPGASSALVSAHVTVGDWVTLDGCRGEPDTGAPPMDLISDESPPLGAETTVERWGGCRGVELWTVHGGAHVPRVRQPAWSQAIYAWLMAHPKP